MLHSTRAVAQTIADIKAELVQKTIIAILYNDERSAAPGYFEPRKVTKDYLCNDGRTRNKLWKELIAGGYITEVFHTFPVEAGVAYFTNKAFDELASAPVDLTQFYKFDAWDAQKDGCNFVSWDRLNVSEKKTVLTTPGFEFMLVDWRANPMVKTPFVKGKIGVAQADRHDCTIAVSDAALQAAHNKASREHFKQEALGSGLNWFLQKIGGVEPEDVVPVRSKQPGLYSQGAAVARDPKDWAASLPNAIEKTKQDIQEARQQLAVLQRVEALVEKMGGWDAFTAQYDAAIECYVDEKLKAS